MYKMKTKYCNRLLKPLFAMMAMLVAACSSDVTTDEPEPLPEGMGRIRISICTPENNPNITRAVNTTSTWLEPNQNWEKLHSFRILIFDKTTGKLEDIIESAEPTMTASLLDPSYQYATVTSGVLPAGTYYVYATANCHKSVNANDAYDDGFVKGNTYTKATIDAMTLNLANGYSEKNIPMSGKLTTAPGGSTLKEVTVTAGSDTDAGTITVWRVISKLQFLFTNEATEQIKIYGIEVEPINTNASNQGLVNLFSQDDLTSTANLAVVDGVSLPTGVTNGKVKHPLTTPSDPLLTLTAKGGTNTTGDLFFYVNETNGTFTTTENEISLRFKIKRGDGTEDELRYGMTTHYGDGTTGQDGFNVIRRNDWIHIPIILTDWQYRVEPIAFVPISGYPPATVSSDGLTATYSTGGMIALQPYIKKKGDATWRLFGSPGVTFKSVHWKNTNGDDVSGTDKIVKTPFTYDTVNKFITGELNNTLASGTYKTTITVNVDLGTAPDPIYHYTFSCNVILQK